MTPAFQGKFFAADDAKQLREILDLEGRSKLRGAAESISWVNALPRVLLTTVDIGTPLIQGQMTLFSHPVVWTKAVRRSLQALVSEQGAQKFLATHADTIQRWAPEGAIFTPSEFTAAMLPTGIVGRTPVLRAAMMPFARSYEHFLNALRIYGLEATEHMAKTPADRQGLAKFWNEMSGVVDTSRQGIGSTQRAVETAVLFAPRYRRAVLSVMTDISRGGLRGKMARDAVGKTLVAGLAGYMGTSYLLGQEPILDPTDRNFLTIKAGDQRVGLGGAFVGASRTLLQIALHPDKAHEYAGKYVENALSPIVGTAERAYHYPFLYNTLPKITENVVAGNLLPIWAQAMLLDEHRDTGSALIGAAVESVGGKTLPEKRIEQLAPKVTAGWNTPMPLGSSGTWGAPNRAPLRRQPAGAQGWSAPVNQAPLRQK